MSAKEPVVFKEYARFYDSIYENKNYSEECQFVDQIMKRFAGKPVKSLLDVGCGTGSHALILNDMGYEITGVDLSEEMLAIAKSKVGDREISLIRQDLRTLDLGHRFDSAIAMFAVMGYQTTNHDFEKALKSVRKQLYFGGVFTFDVWFGPAILNQKPKEQTKTITAGSRLIKYYSQPQMDIINETVRINYRISETEGEIVISETQESHLMRFFFYQELDYFMVKNGFETVLICPFGRLDGGVNRETLSISVIARAV